VPDRAKEYAHRLPQVLPGGKAVLFTVAYGWSGAGGRIEAVILDTGERKVVVDSGLDGRFVPSGHLLFLHHGTLMAAPFDVDRLERTGRPVPVVEGVVHATNLPGGYWNSGSGLLAVSDNGSLVFAPGGMRPDPQRHFMWVGRDGVVEPLLDLPKGPLAQPRLSPDGRWLAFYIRGLDSSLWVHDLHRGTNTRLTQEGRIDRLVWTPDSQRIVFGWTLGGVANLHWISRQGNEPVDRLSTSEFVQQPSSCSPDGRYLAYVHWPLPQGPEIRLLDLKSGVSEPFLQGEHSYGFPDFSPNGRWLAYTSGESGRSEVWITSFPDRDQRVQVSNSGGVAPAWSGEGREIYYLSEHTNGDLMVVQATGDMTLTLGNPRTLIEGPLSTGVPVRTYDVGGDSRRFLFSRTALPAPSAPPVRQLQVVLNWFEELERLVPTE
jgi:serine/threonine-protein kinase